MKKLKVWTCKIGFAYDDELGLGADSPMRHAVWEAYRQITGHAPDVIFSGWGGELDATEIDVLDNKTSSEIQLLRITEYKQQISHSVSESDAK